jgi:hypothetical protein
LGVTLHYLRYGPKEVPVDVHEEDAKDVNGGKP